MQGLYAFPEGDGAPADEHERRGRIAFDAAQRGYQMILSSQFTHR
jgi:hypothetical protein